MCESNPFTPDQLRKGYTQLVVGLRNSSSTLPPLVLLLFSCCLLCVYGMSEKHLRISLACRIIVVVAALFICILLLLLLLLFFLGALGKVVGYFALSLSRSLCATSLVCFLIIIIIHFCWLTNQSLRVCVCVFILFVQKVYDLSINLNKNFLRLDYWLRRATRFALPKSIFIIVEIYWNLTHREASRSCRCQRRHRRRSRRCCRFFRFSRSRRVCARRRRSVNRSGSAAVSASTPTVGFGFGSGSVHFAAMVQWFTILA